MASKHYDFLIFIVLMTVFCSCSTTKQPKTMENNIEKPTAEIATDLDHSTGFLESLLKNNPLYFDQILKDKKQMNIQIIYTEINRDKNGSPEFINHHFNLNKDRYFYPASTVKLPVVLLALQRLQELKDKNINRNTTMLSGADFSGQSNVFNDPATVDGRPTIAGYIKKILMVSDNDAYNRLYEFLGQDYINTELRRKGYGDVQILHRLDIFLSEEENRQTNPVIFYDSINNVLLNQPGRRSNIKYAERKDSIGKGYYSRGKLMEGKMDFSKKNRLGLEDLHHILQSIVFPESVKKEQRFNITEDDRQFVLKYMSQYPTEAVYPPYADENKKYWPAYCKFLLFGATMEKLPDNIRIFNKVGDAYGHMIDAAYVVDLKNKIEFFLSAVIYCNSDGILNDDKYDYETVGKPFMKNLGQVIYDHELKRSRKFKPDLLQFVFTYDSQALK